jgi:aryl carrier-like protein
MQDLTDETRVRALTQLWKDVLGVEQVEEHDDFFALGGHSLTALDLTTRIREEMALDVRLAHLFDNTTFGAMTKIVRTAPPATGAF